MNISASIFSGFILFYSVYSFGQVCAISSSFAQMFSAKSRSVSLTQPYELAFKKSKKDSTKIYQTDGTDTGLLEKLNSAVSDRCQIVLGLFTSRECRLAAPILKQNNIVGFSPSCGDDSIKNFYPHLITAVPNIEQYSKLIAGAIDGSTKKNIYLFVQPSDVFSKNSFEEITKHIERKYTKIAVNREGDFLVDTMDIISPNNSLFVFTTYPLPSYGLLHSLESSKKLNKSVSIIGSTSWAFDNELILKLTPLLHLVGTARVTQIWDLSKSKHNPIFQSLLKHYGAEPPAVTISAYDTAIVAQLCYDKLRNSFTPNRFVDCIIKLDVAGLTGKINLRPGNPFPQRQIKLVNIFTGKPDDN